MANVHAVLMRNDAGEWTVSDLSRSGGVYLNGEQITEPTQVFSGDILRCSTHMLKFADMSEERRAVQEQRRTIAGRKVSAGGTLFFLTVFQLLLALEFVSSADSAHLLGILMSFAALALTQWFCYVLMRTMDRSGFEVETIAFFLCTLGLEICATSTPDDLTKEIILILVGIALFFLLGWWLRDLSHVKALRWPAAIISLALLALNLFAAREVFGAKNWLTIAGFSLQPSELIKVAFIYVGATSLNRMFRSKSILLFIVFSAICVGGLALMGDFGSALIFFATFLVIAFMRSGSIATVLLAVTSAAMAGTLVLSIKPHVAQRFATWGHVWDDPLGAGYQQVRAMSATASGGLFGQGAGRGWLKSVAAADTDLVFGMVAEELGLVVAFGCLAAIILLALFTVRNASAGRSSYYVIAACAAVTIMMVQTSLNVFGSLDILPFTGVTLPFVSRGGSSLISCWAMLAYIKAGDTRQNASFALTDGLEDEEYGEEYGEYEDDGEEYGPGEEDGSAGDEGGEDGEE